MYKYGFIGMGNMGQAVLTGLIKKGVARGEEIVFSSFSPEKMEKISALTGAVPAEGGLPCERNKKTAEGSELLILAVKPQVLPSVCGEIKEVIRDGQIIVSLAAGINTATLSELLSGKGKPVRVMPNTPAAIGEGMSAVCFSEKAGFGGEEKEKVKEIFKACGDIAEVTEKGLDAIGVTAGSSPAFTYMYIDALAEAGVKFGLKRDEALHIAAKAVMGAAAMVLESGEHPEALKNKVCSPGGTTIEGVERLYELGLKNAVMKACTACMEKTERLSGK